MSSNSRFRDRNVAIERENVLKESLGRLLELLKIIQNIFPSPLDVFDARNLLRDGL